MPSMKISHSEYTISELMEMLKRRDIIINKSYQRGAGLWPDTARTYFIDTILEGFPFPKLYFYQSLDRISRKPIKEVVDGQQRLTTIKDFIENKFKLGSGSKSFSGKYFIDLDVEIQEEFLMYSVATDVILAAERPLLLEMFRRINAYTAPLNSAEKRHAEFQGPFKWFINDISDKYSPILESYEILTEKQLIRMGDAELFTELILVIEDGIIHKSATSLRGIYDKYDNEFHNKDLYYAKIKDFFNTVTNELTFLRNTFMMKPYVFHSLFTAMTHLKYGIPGGVDALESEPIGKYYIDLDSAQINLLQLAEAHETQDMEGKFSEYVSACLETTTKIAQRKIRSRFIVKALKNKLG